MVENVSSFDLDQWLEPQFAALDTMQGSALGEPMTHAASFTSPMHGTHPNPATQISEGTSATQIEPCLLGSLEGSQEVEPLLQATEPIAYEARLKVNKNGRKVYNDTEPRVTEVPSVHWRTNHLGRIAQVREQEGLLDGNVTRIRTSVTVSLSGRGGGGLTKTFDFLGVDWSALEEKLTALSAARRAGSEAVLKVFVEVNIKTETRSSNAKIGAGRSSRTTDMLEKRKQAIDDEEAATGRAAEWPSRLRAARCTDPRHSGRHCHVDHRTGKHSILRSGDIQRFVKDKGHPQPNSRNSQQPRSVTDGVSKDRGATMPRIHSHSPASALGTSPSSTRSTRSSAKRWSYNYLSTKSEAELARLFCLEDRDEVEVMRAFGVWRRSNKVKNKAWQKLDEDAEEIAVVKGIDIIQIGFKTGDSWLVEYGASKGPVGRMRSSVVPFLLCQMTT